MRDLWSVISDFTCLPDPVLFTEVTLLHDLIDVTIGWFLMTDIMPGAALFTGERGQAWFKRALTRIYFCLIPWFYSTLSFKIKSQLQGSSTLEATVGTRLTPPALQLFAQCGLCLSFDYHFYCHRTPSNSIIVTVIVTDSPGIESVKHTRAWIKHYGLHTELAVRHRLLKRVFSVNGCPYLQRDISQAHVHISKSAS